MIKLEMPGIKSIEALVRKTDDCISFAQGALMIGGVDPDIKAYARQILKTDKADFYHDALGLLALRKKIAESLSEKHDSALSLDNVFISHGSIGALTSLCLTLLDRDDEVIIPEPAYPVYHQTVMLSKAKPVFVAAGFEFLDKEKNFFWDFSLEAIKKALTDKTKMIILSNPCNPTGACLSKKHLDELHKLCEEKGIYLVLDEIYDDYIFEGTFTSGTGLVPTSELVIRIGSFSKSFGMSGWRVGFAIASVRLINAVMPVQAAILSCPSLIGQYAALYGLEHKSDILNKYRDKLDESRDLACSFFDMLHEQGIISYIKPEAGFYIFFKTNEEDGLMFVHRILEYAKIGLAPGSDFGPHFRSYARFCFAREPEVVAQGIKRLQDFFSRERLLTTQSAISKSA